MIYIAAPLFNARERDFNSHIKRLLIEIDDVYLPQENGGLISDLIKNGKTLDAASREVYLTDVIALQNCNLLVAILDGPHVDSGVAFEIGYVTSLNKPALGLHTDFRTELTIGFNPMIRNSVKILSTEAMLCEEVARLTAPSA